MYERQLSTDHRNENNSEFEIESTTSKLTTGNDAMTWTMVALLYPDHGQECKNGKEAQSPASSDDELSELEESDPLLAPGSSKSPAPSSVSGKHFLHGWNPLSNSCNLKKREHP